MRALLMFLILAFTYVVAGVYQSKPLALLSGAELVLMVLFGFLPLLYRFTVRLWFPDRLTETVRGADALCRLDVRNTGPLPLGRVELRVSVQATGDRRPLRRKLYGGAERGESRLEFRIRAPYCGLVLVKIERVRFYDYLSLFSSSRREKEELRLAVYPPDLPLRMGLAGGGGDSGAPLMISSRPGDSGDEIEKLREYAPGDPVRRAHWNLSARTDQLWIKEYQRETDSRAALALDTPGFSAANPETADAFYRVLSAVVLGLVNLPASVRVLWRRGGGEQEMEVKDAAQCRELLLKLYQSPPEGRTDAAGGGEERCLRLTGGLSLYAEDRLIAQFHRENLDWELTEEAVTV